MTVKKHERLGEEKYNNKGYLMKIIEYNGCSDIVVEFQDENKGSVHTSYQMFRSGAVRNPYQPNSFGVGMVGVKYSTRIGESHTKEYQSWQKMLIRCFDENYKNKHKTYKDVTCCDEWLYYEKFYEWMHSQENFDKWYTGKQWNLDKDILVKNNKIYSPDTCCLVPDYINKMFVKTNALRGNLPIGVSKDRNSFKSLCSNPFTKKCEFLGEYKTPIDAFQKYKEVKESYIKEVARIEYMDGNITRCCYDAMMNYEVEITD